MPLRSMRFAKLALLALLVVIIAGLALSLLLHFKPELLAERIELESNESTERYQPDHQSRDWEQWFQAQPRTWRSARTPLLTPWSERLNTQAVLGEYPRPQLQREHWLNLNGLWSFNVVNKKEESVENFPGEILVPFALEAPLSGVGRPLYAGERLWYQRYFEVPKNWNANERVVLHFGAVDHHAEVFVNKQSIGEHTGGYAPFSFDITHALNQEDANELVVAVLDPGNADGATQQRGKQHLNPASVFYTATSGIWQTVWLEPLAESVIANLEVQSNISAGSASIRALVDGPVEDLSVRVQIKGEDKIFTGRPNESIEVQPAVPELWSPDNPHLYPVVISLWADEQLLDKVESYFALREVGRTIKNGQSVFTLNGDTIFHLGPLDQGYWPDGGMTPPSDKALIYDLELIKSLGMNTVRKHIKVEPARFYYHADRLGLMVWQDMPNGGSRIMPTDSVVQIMRFILPFGVTESKLQFPDNRYESWGRDAASRKSYELELQDMIDHLRFFPSIVMWVPFNEYWGQFDAARIATWAKNYDPTRLVNNASGWVDQGAGDVYDQHIYSGYGRIKDFSDPVKNRVGVLGEFGGKTLSVQGHLWTEDVFGYGPVADREALFEAYNKLLRDHVIPGIKRGLGGAIYTQVSDIEREINGLVTYDRKVEKFDREKMRRLHADVYAAFKARFEAPATRVPN